MPPMPIAEAMKLPVWQRPTTLLMLMAFAMPLAFATWSAMLNNYAVEVIDFDGYDIGVLHVAREIPGFLAFLVIYILIFIHEQRLAIISLLLLGLGTAVTADLPTFHGLLLVTIISSVGFHYYETVNQSLQLQWLDKAKAPKTIGWIVSLSGVGSLVAFGTIILGREWFGWGYSTLYWIGGGGCAVIALIVWLVFPAFKAPVTQHRKMIVRQRYWLYYMLVLIGGARRQIFIVFAPFMLVEKFGMAVHEVTGLMLANYIATVLFAPIAGRMISRFGERFALVLEYIGLFTVFVLYAGVYYFDWGVMLAMALYVCDHLLFSLAIAQKTYLQKIADPADQAPTAAVSFTINHIAAVTLPAPMGLLWLASPAAVFGLAASLALVSLTLATMVPRHPAAGRETVFTPVPQPAE